DDVRYNHPLGNFIIEGLARVPAGNLITVQFDLNLDGILKVAAREKATGLQRHITIDNALRHIEADQVREARDQLGATWDASFPDDEELVSAAIGAADVPIVPELVAGPPEGQRETVQARALIEKAERMLPDMTSEDQSEVRRILEQIRHAIVDRK